MIFKHSHHHNVMEIVVIGRLRYVLLVELSRLQSEQAELFWRTDCLQHHGEIIGFTSKHQRSSTATMPLDPGCCGSPGWVDCTDWVCLDRQSKPSDPPGKADLVILGSGCSVASELDKNDVVVLGYVCLVKNLALG